MSGYPNPTPSTGSAGGVLTGSYPNPTLASAGSQTAPGVPASTTPLANPFTNACLVQVTGGTVTVIAVAGVAVGGLTAGVFLVPAGSTITLTYAVAPSWRWYQLPA